VTVEALKAQTAPVEAKRAPRARRRFPASSIAAALVATALIGLNFRAEVAAYVTRYVGQQDIFGVSTIGRQVVEQETRLPSQDSRKTDSLALQQRTEADQASAQEAAQVKQAAEASAPEARQSLERSSVQRFWRMSLPRPGVLSMSSICSCGRRPRTPHNCSDRSAKKRPPSCKMPPPRDKI
jgi:hypothetical protein